MGLGPAAPADLSAAEFPDVYTAFNAEAAYVNAHGGANGHKIVVDVCYDQGDANVAAGCAKQAVSQGDVAVMAPFIETSDNVLPILEAAHIPYFGQAAVSPLDYSSPASYPIAGGIPIDYGAMGYGLATRGCKKLGILATATSTNEAATPYIARAAESEGAKVVINTTIPETSVDASSQVAEIEQAGAECLAIDVNPNQGPPILEAVNQSGQKLTVAGLTASFPNSLLKTIGTAANGLILDGSEALPSDTSNPAILQMIATTKKYEPSSPQVSSNFGTLAYSDAVMMFTKVIPSVSGTVTGAKVASAIEGLKNANTGITPAYTGSTPPAIASLPRIINYGVTFWKVENGVPVSIQKGFVDIAKSVS